MYDILELNKKVVSELREIAKGLKIKRVESLRKQDIIYKILDQQAISATEKNKGTKENTHVEAKGVIKDARPQIKESSRVMDKKPRVRRRRVDKLSVDKPSVPETTMEINEIDEPVVETTKETNKIDAAVAEVEAALNQNERRDTATKQ